MARINPDYITSINDHLERYMQSGLDEKKALIKMLSEDRLEISPGLHVPPTLDDILREIEREFKFEHQKQKFLTKSKSS